jgi:hypothetical protein
LFQTACKTLRESIYGVLCQTPLGDNKVNFGNGTAFMIAPGICATAAHVLHVEGNKTKPIHQQIELIRTPDIGKQMSLGKLIAEDIERDLALVEIINPTSIASVNLYQSKIDNGINCGSLGFPLASVIPVNNQIGFNLIERFQGAYISAFRKNSQNPDALDFYETDSLMYGGSSGCPGFTTEEKIFGMHVSTVTDGVTNSNSARLAISLWVPSMDIIKFAGENGIINLSFV